MNGKLLALLGAMFLLGGKQTYTRRRKRISWKKRYYGMLRRKRFRRFRRKSYNTFRHYLQNRRYRRFNRYNSYNRYY